jgi:hypothetical protein
MNYIKPKQLILRTFRNLISNSGMVELEGTIEYMKSGRMPEELDRESKQRLRFMEEIVLFNNSQKLRNSSISVGILDYAEVEKDLTNSLKEKEKIVGTLTTLRTVDGLLKAIKNQSIRVVNEKLFVNLLKREVTGYMDLMESLHSSTFSDEDLMNYFKHASSFKEFYHEKIKDLMDKEDREFRSLEASLFFNSSSLDPIRLRLEELATELRLALAKETKSKLIENRHFLTDRFDFIQFKKSLIRKMRKIHINASQEFDEAKELDREWEVMEDFENAVCLLEANEERFNQFIPTEKMSLTSLDVDELKRLIEFVNPRKDLVLSKRRPELIPVEELSEVMSRVTLDPVEMVEFLTTPENKTEQLVVDWVTAVMFHKSDQSYPEINGIKDFVSDLREELDNYIN